jgi:hypothetical protein
MAPPGVFSKMPTHLAGRWLGDGIVDKNRSAMILSNFISKANKTNENSGDEQLAGNYSFKNGSFYQCIIHGFPYSL